MFQPATRAAALEALHEFNQHYARAYRSERNKVIPGHPNVTSLSGAVRHRLISEYEMADLFQSSHPFFLVEKLIQEVYWRRYWKSWLDLRPQVWRKYQEELADPEPYDRDQAEALMAGEGEVAIMNHFARELTETGYLHNHARMWFAAYWIHVARLPWVVGADYFYRHLLCGDPASNTLSWRWVAGLQTLGKSYLPRRSNIEKFTDHRILDLHRAGLDKLERPEARSIAGAEKEEITHLEPDLEPADSHQKTAFWIHEEDLDPPQTRDLTLIIQDEARWEKMGYSEVKRKWLRQALADTATRFPNAIFRKGPAPALITEFCVEHGVSQLELMAPSTGEIRDQLPELPPALNLVYQTRPRDLALHPLARAGFFSFWKKVQRQLKP